MSGTCPYCDAPQDAGLLCSSCCDQLERDLGDVPAIVVDLDITISRQAKIGQAGKGGPAHERTPVHLGAVAVADDLQNTLTSWARDVTEACGWVWVASKAPPSSQSAAALLMCIDTIRRHPAVAELVDEVTDAIRQARRVVDRPLDRQYLGQCMAQADGVICYEEIYARLGAHEVACKVCGITHVVVERRAWLLQRAEDLLVTVREASSYMGEVGGIRVTQAAIRGYLHRGRIGYRTGTMIRLGDLLAVVVDDGEKRSA
jgi:hypothetical protein